MSNVHSSAINSKVDTNIVSSVEMTQVNTDPVSTAWIWLNDYIQSFDNLSVTLPKSYGELFNIIKSIDVPSELINVYRRWNDTGITSRDLEIAMEEDDEDPGGGQIDQAINAIIKFMKNGSLTDLLNNNGMFNRLFMLATRHGYLSVVMYLLDERVGEKSDIHVVLLLLLPLAAQHGHLEIVKYFLERTGEKLNIHRFNDEAFRWAAGNGQLKVVRYFLERKGEQANIHAENDDALRSAAEHGNLAVVKYLLDDRPYPGEKANIKILSHQFLPQNIMDYLKDRRLRKRSISEISNSHLDNALLELHQNNLDTTLAGLLQTCAINNGEYSLSQLNEVVKITSEAGLNQDGQGIGQEISISPLMHHMGRVISVTYSPDGKFIASSSTDHIINIYDVENNDQFGKIITPSNHYYILSIAYSPDGQFIATGATDKNIRIWDVAAGGQENRKLGGHKAWINSVAFSPNGQFIASGSGDKTIRIWNAENGQYVMELNGHNDRVKSVAYSPNGKFIASGSRDRTIRIWDAENGHEKKNLEGHTNSVASVAYSPDGKFIASGSRDRTIRIWDAENGQYIRNLQGHTDKVHSVAYSPNGKYIASGSADKTIRIWDVETALQIIELKGHTDIVVSVVYSPNGQFIASGSNDRTVRIWKVANEQQVSEPQVAEPQVAEPQVAEPLEEDKNDNVAVYVKDLRYFASTDELDKFEEIIQILMQKDDWEVLANTITEELRPYFATSLLFRETIALKRAAVDDCTNDVDPLSLVLLASLPKDQIVKIFIDSNVPIDDVKFSCFERSMLFKWFDDLNQQKQSYLHIPFLEINISKEDRVILQNNEYVIAKKHGALYKIAPVSKVLLTSILGKRKR